MVGYRWNGWFSGKKSGLVGRKVVLWVWMRWISRWMVSGSGGWMVGLVRVRWKVGNGTWWKGGWMV